MPKKPTGEIGATKIMFGPQGATAEVQSTELPDNKEALELFFAERFVEAYNQANPLGVDTCIANLKPNMTSDLDFDVECSIADYIELAELNPRSEAFGRQILRTGKFNVYDYAKWIYFKIVRRKMLSYGVELSSRTILLLYFTHWQFMTSLKTIDCVRALIAERGCDFRAVFVLETDGKDLKSVVAIAPHDGAVDHKSGAYRGFTVTNSQPKDLI